MFNFPIFDLVEAFYAIYQFYRYHHHRHFDPQMIHFDGHYLYSQYLPVLPDFVKILLNNLCLNT